jgi:hypothetical protein
MPSRAYRDPSGTEWDVFEVHRLAGRSESVRPALAGGWLAFVSAEEKRRLPRYPADWMQRSDDELQELLREAFVAPDAIYPGLAGGGRGPSPESGDSRVAARPPQIDGGLPVPPPTTVTGRLGTAGIDALVRQHARDARRSGTAVIEGMIAVKRALGDAGEDVSPEVLRQLRKAFVDEFYFAR